MSRCPACPLASGETCYGDTGDLPHLCEWAASGDPLKVQSVIDRAQFPPPSFTLPMPGLLARAAHLAVAVVSHVVAGMPTLAEPEYQARLAICQPCEQRSPGGSCAGCGCNLAVKARWAGEDCPLGKWMKIEPIGDQP